MKLELRGSSVVEKRASVPWRTVLAGAMVMALPVFLLWGCGASVQVPALTGEEIPKFEAAGNYPHQKYVIEAEDTVQIRYTFHPEMNQVAIVRPDGKITASVVGEIIVAGKPTAEVEKLLVAKTSDRLRNPDVVVSITKYAEKNVYVGGEVRKPGMVRYRRGLTPIQAIIAAGGMVETGEATSVILVRSHGLGESFIARKMDLTETVTESVKEQPIFLAPHDVVYVPRSSIAEANLWVKQHITELFPFLRGTAGASYRFQ